MNANEVVKEVIERQGFTTAKLRVALGMDSKKSNVLASRLNQDNMSISILDEMLSKMGYMLVAMPSNGDMPKNGIRVDYHETQRGAERKKEMRDARKNKE